MEMLRVEMCTAYSFVYGNHIGMHASGRTETITEHTPPDSIEVFVNNTIVTFLTYLSILGVILGLSAMCGTH